MGNQRPMHSRRASAPARPPRHLGRPVPRPPSSFIKMTLGAPTGVDVEALKAENEQMRIKCDEMALKLEEANKKLEEAPKEE